jgi:predicted RNase H-like HicB family nuclease
MSEIEMAKPEEYGISVRLVREDGEDMYEARVQELPDVRTYGETYTKAYLGAVEVIRTTQEVFAEKGRPFPEVEAPEDEFSGRVTLRMSKSLHRAIHEKAQRDAVSLNQWIVEAVSVRVTGAAGGSVFVMSPMRHAQTGLQYCIQPAQHLTTAVTSLGLNYTLLATPGMLEAPLQTRELVQNRTRALK